MCWFHHIYLQGISTSNERNDEDNYDEDSNEEDGDEDDEDDDHVEENGMNHTYILILVLLIYLTCVYLCVVDISRSMSISGLIGKGLSTASNLLPGNSGLLSITNMSGKEINTTQSASTSESELRTILKKKNLEIEKLNGECLELEESCTSLKKEVEEAWASYKSSQEKAMLRESELQEEIRMIQKAKSTDKQQLQVQISRMNEDTSELLKRIKSLESERDHAATTFNEMSEQSQLWEQKESEFFSQIEDLKANSVQGTHNLREEYQREKDVNQALRTEHQSILRQNEQTLRELESQNMANIQALSDKEKELISFKVLLSQAGGPKEHQSTLRDLESIRNDYDNLVKLHDESSIKVNQYERRIKQLETEHKVTIIKYEDDRQRSQELLSLTDKKVLELQDKIQTMTENNINMNMNMSSGTYNGSTDQNTSVNNSNDSVARVPGTSVDMLSTTTTSNMHSKVTQLMEQIQSLSKQLLKKQEQVMELQTEKSVLKSRTTDLLARYDLFYVVICI